MLREKLSAASFVVACTAFCAETLRRRFPDLGAGVAVIRHGLPRAYLAGKSFRPADGRSRVVYVGRFVAKKGLDTLLDACRQLASWGVPFSCHLYGSGPLRGDLERFVSACGLEDIVLFHGEVANEEFYSTMNQDDLFVCPSRVLANGDRDGIPVSMMEAMAGGITVVSTPVSGIPELVTDGVNGYLVPPGDADALAALLRRLLTTPSLRHAVSAAAAATIRERFSVETAVDLLDARLAASR
jgi:glycosyltransferase involved in cell wall biosynthesis